MLQQNYELEEKRIALKLYKGIKQLQVPQPQPLFQLQNKNFNSIIQFWIQIQKQINRKFDLTTLKLNSLEEQIQRLKKIIQTTNNRKYNQKLQKEALMSTACKSNLFTTTTSNKKSRYNRNSQQQQSLQTFKSVPILRFDSKDDDLLMEINETIRQNQDNNNKDSGQMYSFCNKIQEDGHSDKESLQNNKNQLPAEYKKLNFNYNSKFNLRKQPFKLIQPKSELQNRQSITKKQIGVNTILIGNNQGDDSYLLKGKIEPISKATTFSASEDEHHQLYKSYESPYPEYIKERQMFSKQLKQLKQIIMTTHHHHTYLKQSQLKNDNQNQANSKIHEDTASYSCPQYTIKNLDLRDMISQLKGELKGKIRQIEDYKSLLIKMKQTVIKLKGQFFSQLLPCQYCTFREFVSAQINNEQENDHFGVKN